VRLPDVVRTTTIRWALAVSGIYALALMTSFGLVYVRATTAITASADVAISEEADVIARAAPDRRLDLVAERMRQDPRRVKPIGLFDPLGRLITGNIAALPPGLSPGRAVQDLAIIRMDAYGHDEQVARSAVRRLEGGQILIVAWFLDYNNAVASNLKSGLIISLVPTLLLGLAVGIVLAIRSQRRIAAISDRVGRIVAGDLRQRLPGGNTHDAFDRLAAIVNGMLDDMEVLIRNLAGVADDIAHDLRTPLTRARISLERGRHHCRTLEDLQAVTDQAIANIDKVLAIVTALLRIREIENTRRLEAFADVDLAAIARDVAEFYQPIAEEKGIAFATRIEPVPPVRGDPALLAEALTNLVDNGVKFTPSGGSVTLTVDIRDGIGVAGVDDSGPGIPEDERDLVMRRFYRSDRSRSSDGVGLGLSLVGAIAKLHGFTVSVSAGPGCRAEIRCGGGES
jgi:signal transduction histidine kinase